jgi:hypothetical protein
MHNNNRMMDLWNRVLRRRISKNGIANGLPATYGLDVVDVDDLGSRVLVDFAFLRGQTYCCLELGCHFNFAGERFQDLREILSTDAPIASISITTRVTVEEGVRWCYTPREPAHIVSEPYCYVVTMSEGS